MSIRVGYSGQTNDKIVLYSASQSEIAHFSSGTDVVQMVFEPARENITNTLVLPYGLAEQIPGVPMTISATASTQSFGMYSGTSPLMTLNYGSQQGDIYMGMNIHGGMNVLGSLSVSSNITTMNETTGSLQIDQWLCPQSSNLMCASLWNGKNAMCITSNGVVVVGGGQSSNITSQTFTSNAGSFQVFGDARVEGTMFTSNIMWSPTAISPAITLIPHPTRSSIVLDAQNVTVTNDLTILGTFQLPAQVQVNSLIANNYVTTRTAVLHGDDAVVLPNNPYDLLEFSSNGRLLGFVTSNGYLGLGTSNWGMCSSENTMLNVIGWNCPSANVGSNCHVAHFEGHKTWVHVSSNGYLGLGSWDPPSNIYVDASHTGQVPIITCSNSSYRLNNGIVFEVDSFGNLAAGGEPSNSYYGVAVSNLLGSNITTFSLTSPSGSINMNSNTLTNIDQIYASVVNTSLLNVTEISLGGVEFGANGMINFTTPTAFTSFVCMGSADIQTNATTDGLLRVSVPVPDYNGAGASISSSGIVVERIGKVNMNVRSSYDAQLQLTSLVRSTNSVAILGMNNGGMYIQYLDDTGPKVLLEPIEAGGGVRAMNHLYVRASSRMGVGIANPMAPLEVGGQMNVWQDAFKSGGNPVITAQTINGSGRVGINTSNPLYTLHINGRMYATTTVTSSDIRKKKKLQRIEGALDKVEQLTGYKYIRKDTKEPEIGLVAQEVQKVLPEAVSKGEDGYLSLAYGNMVALLVEAIKELKAEVAILKAEK